MTIEYKVRPVTRYVVTRWEAAPAQNDTLNRACGTSSVKGEFDNYSTAYSVAYALAKHEHEQLGYPIDDPRIQYPASLKGGPELGGATQAPQGR